MRFRLASLLMFITFLAVAGGLGYQIHLLRQQVAQLQKQVKARPPMQVVVAGNWPTNSKNAVFRLIDTGATVHPMIEDGMKADEFELHQRNRERLSPDSILAPERSPSGLGIDRQ